MPDIGLFPSPIGVTEAKITNFLKCILRVEMLDALSDD